MAFVVRLDIVSLLFFLVAVTLLVLLFLSWRVPTQEFVLNNMSQKTITVDNGVAKIPLQSPLLPATQVEQAAPPVIFAEDDLGRLRLQAPFVFPEWEQFLHDTTYASLPVARQSRIDVEGDLPTNVLTIAEVKPGGWTFGGKEMQALVNPFTREPAISIRNTADNATSDLTPPDLLPRPFFLADNRQMYMTPSELMF